METVYLVCAAVGGTLIVCQFLVTLLGIGGHHDVGGGHDVAGDMGGGHDAPGHDHDTSHDAQSAWIFSVLTFRALSAAFAFFGLAGLTCIRFGMDPWTGVAIALAAGAAALFIVGWLMQLLSRLNVDGTIRIDRAVGSRGTVYLSVPGCRAGAGKVHVNVLNRTLEYKAITAQQELPTGAKIVVVGIVSADTVEVQPAPEPERIAHV